MRRGSLPGCHELRVDDDPAHRSRRIVYRLDEDAVVVLEVFAKATRETPRNIILTCRRRLRSYEEVIDEE